jgi:hypothetical protein
MLTIPGVTVGDVFSRLAIRTELDADERAAARLIAHHIGAVETAKSDALEAMLVTGDHEAWEDAVETVSRLSLQQPFIGNLMQADTGADWRTATVGDIRFIVYPYTIGATMNVGVDRI